MKGCGYLVTLRYLFWGGQARVADSTSSLTSKPSTVTTQRAGNCCEEWPHPCFVLTVILYSPRSLQFVILRILTARWLVHIIIVVTLRKCSILFRRIMQDAHKNATTSITNDIELRTMKSQDSDSPTSSVYSSVGRFRARSQDIGLRQMVGREPETDSVYSEVSSLGEASDVDIPEGMYEEMDVTEAGIV